MFWHVPFTHPWPDGQQVVPQTVVSVGHSQAQVAGFRTFGDAQVMLVGHSQAQVAGFCTFGDAQVLGHSHAQVL